MVGTIIYYLTYPFLAPIVTLIALMDLPKNRKEFKENFISIYGGLSSTRHKEGL